MRRHHTWLIIAALIVGALLWLWTQRPHEPGGALPSPPPATVPAEASARGGDGAEPPTAPPVGARAPSSSAAAPVGARPVTYPTFLPAEAHAVLAAIQRGGPYAYRRDGVVFQNRERLLPQRPRGYYHEFTVPTPGEDDRGARRIVTGGDLDGPPREFWYSPDHYRSFRGFRVDAAQDDRARSHVP